MKEELLVSPPPPLPVLVCFFRFNLLNKWCTSPLRLQVALFLSCVVFPYQTW